MSAAYNNSNSEDGFTARFADLPQHYGFKPSRNNRGVAHENGAIESPNNHLKNQLRQALLIRDSHDFNSREEYESFVESVIERHNRRIKPLLIDEQRQLHPLPEYDSVNYTEHRLKVSTSSTIQLKRVTYSVPSRLIGSTGGVHLFDKKLDVYCGGEWTLTLERVYVQGSGRGHPIDYRHLINGLMKKPRAFRGCQWRDKMLPNADYQRIWAYVDQTLNADEASFYMVRLLNIASKSGRESALGRFVLDGIALGPLPSVFDCEDRFLSNEEWCNPEDRTTRSISLSEPTGGGERSCELKHCCP